MEGKLDPVGCGALLVSVQLAQAYQGSLVLAGSIVRAGTGSFGDDVFVGSLGLPGLCFGKLLGFLDPLRFGRRHCGRNCWARVGKRMGG